MTASACFFFAACISLCTWAKLFNPMINSPFIYSQTVTSNQHGYLITKNSNLSIARLLSFCTKLCQKCKKIDFSPYFPGSLAFLGALESYNPRRQTIVLGNLFPLTICHFTVILMHSPAIKYPKFELNIHITPKHIPHAYCPILCLLHKIVQPAQKRKALLSQSLSVCRMFGQGLMQW